VQAKRWCCYLAVATWQRPETDEAFPPSGSNILNSVRNVNKLASRTPPSSQPMDQRKRKMRQKIGNVRIRQHVGAIGLFLLHRHRSAAMEIQKVLLHCSATSLLTNYGNQTWCIIIVNIITKWLDQWTHYNYMNYIVYSFRSMNPL